MIGQHELGQWFYETTGLKLFQLSSIAIPAFAGTLIIPLVAWLLKRRGYLSPVAQRLIEIAWLVVSAQLAVVGWAIWAIDYLDRIPADPVTPFVWGFFVGIVVVVLGVSGIRQWRSSESFAMRPLIVALLDVTMHVCLYGLCLGVVAMVAFFAFLGGNAFAAAFTPIWANWLFFVFSTMVYLVLAPQVVRMIRCRLSIRTRSRAAS
jgi:hypothetical protein